MRKQAEAAGADWTFEQPITCEIVVLGWTVVIAGRTDQWREAGAKIHIREIKTVSVSLPRPLGPALALGLGLAWVDAGPGSVPVPVGDPVALGVGVCVDVAEALKTSTTVPRQLGAGLWRYDFAGSRLGTLMNNLAASPEGLLVSRDFLTERGLRPGDLLRLNVTTPDGVVELDAHGPRRGPALGGVPVVDQLALVHGLSRAARRRSGVFRRLRGTYYKASRAFSGAASAP